MAEDGGVTEDGGMLIDGGRATQRGIYSPSEEWKALVQCMSHQVAVQGDSKRVATQG